MSDSQPEHVLVPAPEHVPAPAPAPVPSPVRQVSAPARPPTKPVRYCTQDCLLGVNYGLPLDLRCPNVLAHLGTRTCAMTHPVDGLELVRLAQLQLRAQPRLALMDGAFGLVLAPHGYAFVAKGIRPRHVGRLGRECAAYLRMEPIQGWAVPVYLGFAQMDDFVLPGGTRLAYIMFMSWGGQDMTDDDVLAAPTYQQSVDDVATYAVDTDYAKALWNAERRRVVLVNFVQ